MDWSFFGMIPLINYRVSEIIYETETWHVGVWAAKPMLPANAQQDFAVKIAVIV